MQANGTQVKFTIVPRRNINTGIPLAHTCAFPPRARTGKRGARAGGRGVGAGAVRGGGACAERKRTETSPLPSPLLSPAGFFLIEMPEYTSFDVCKRMLQLAVTYGAGEAFLIA